MSLVTERTVRSTRKAKGDGHLRRAEILDAAERIFLECGYEGATIRRIADEVGVSSTALYMHFRDKSDILVEICAGLFGKLITINAELSAAELDPVVRVRRMLEAYIDFAFENPSAYRLLFCSPPGMVSGDKERELSALGERTYVLFEGAVARIHAAGRLPMGDVPAAAQAGWAACHGIVSLVLTRPTFHWTDRQALRQAVLNMVDQGLTHA